MRSNRSYRPMMLLRDSKSPNITSCCALLMTQMEIHSETTTISKTKTIRTVVSLGFIGTLLVELITSRHRLVHPRTGLCIYVLWKFFLCHCCFRCSALVRLHGHKPCLTTRAPLRVLRSREPFMRAFGAPPLEHECVELLYLRYIHI